MQQDHRQMVIQRSRATGRFEAVKIRQPHEVYKKKRVRKLRTHKNHFYVKFSKRFLNFRVNALQNFLNYFFRQTNSPERRRNGPVHMMMID